MSVSVLRRALALATALTACTAHADETPPPQADDTRSLEAQFQDPPQSARPRVWWHWMNGNITKDGIAKDIAWMKRVGIGGLQNFDANLRTPQVVKDRLVYMTPAWKDAFRFAASEADRRGLELAIASSPGWSETGGPWVPPQDGLKKLVWSETEIAGGRHFTGKLPPPPSLTGPYQTVPKAPSIEEMMSGTKNGPRPTFYADAVVLAYPLAEVRKSPQARIYAGDGSAIDGAALADADQGSVVELPLETGKMPSIVFEYPAAQTIRSATLFLPGAAMMFFGANVQPHLEASDDGVAWRAVAEIPATPVPTTVSFPAVTARRFRVVFAPGAPSKFSQGAPSEGAVAPDYSGLAAAMAGRKTRIGELRLWPDARIDRFEAKAGFDVEADYFALSKGLGEAEGVAPAKVIDLTSRMAADGSLDWTPPAGRWRVVRLGYSLLGTENHPATREATGLEVDKFDGSAVRRYLDHYLGMYRDTVGNDLVGKRGVRALLTDSIEVGAANWTPRMIDQFKRLRGYDPTPWLPALTGTIVGSRTQSDRFLYDFRRTLADLMASEHYGTIAAVAHENGLKVYGEALENGRPSLGDDMAMRRHADIPMSAMWTHTRAEGPRPAHVADIKGAASVAHIYGQNLVATESLTSSVQPWAHGPAYLKRIIDLEFVTGVNRPIIHTSVHQPVDDKVPGVSLMHFGQFFNRHEAWAELAKPWVDYISRNALLLQQGRNVADVGYFYGEEAPLTALYFEKGVADAPTSYAYDFVNADALTGALVNDGADLVSPGGARYRALYLGGSSRRMTIGTLRRLATLVEGGATVIGTRPENDPGLSHDPTEYAALTAKLWGGGGATKFGKGQVIASRDVEAALQGIGVAPDFRFSGGSKGADIPFVHRRLADGDSYFVANRQDRPETIEARFRVTGKAPELWHAETGRSEAVGYRIENDETVIPLTLAADESVHVVFRKPAVTDALAIKKLAPVPLARLDGGWSVAFQPNRGAPASAQLAGLAPLNENADPGIKYFSGIATYAKDFAAPQGWKRGDPLWIDLGDAREIAEVTINGTLVGAVWHAPFRLDVGQAVRPGKNRLEIRVANLWVNRLIGDAQPGAKPITWTAMPTYRPDAPLRPSGLIGPVELLGQAKN